MQLLCVTTENNVMLLRYVDFCVFEKFTDLKICDIIISTAT